MRISQSLGRIVYEISHPKTHLRPAKNELSVPSQPEPTKNASLSTPSDGSRDRAEKLRLAGRIVDAGLPLICEMAAISISAVHERTGYARAHVSVLSNNYEAALRRSKARKKLAAIRASTMSIQTLRERVALIGSSIVDAENHYTLAFCRGVTSLAATPLNGGKVQWSPGQELSERAKTVRTIYALMPANPRAAKPGQLEVTFSKVAEELSASELQVLLDYYRSDAGRRYAKQWLLGEPRAGALFGGYEVREILRRVHRNLFPDERPAFC